MTGPWKEVVAHLPPRRRARPRRAPALVAGLLAVVLAGAAAAWALTRSGPEVPLDEAFPDGGLARCVAHALDVDADAAVPVRELEQVRVLDCAARAVDGSGADRAAVRRLDGAERLSGLEELTLAWQEEVDDLRPLAGVPRLRTLDLSYVPILDLTGVESMPALTDLRVVQDGCFDRTGEARLRDIAPLAGADSLETVALACTAVSDLTPLAGLDGLTTLELQATPVSDLTPLADLPALRSVFLAHTRVIDVSPLAGVETLRSLDLTGTDVTDVSALDGLPELELTR